MSFDIFLNCYDENGESETFPFALIEREFGPFAAARAAKWWDLIDPDGGRCELYVDATEATIGHFMVASPPVHIAFWQSILNLLQRTPSCLHWPGGGPVIAQAFVRDHLPQYMIEGLGEPKIVSTPEQILQAIRDS